MSRKRHRGQKGAGMVETALVITTFVCMMLFILDMGRILLFDQFFAERVRVAARAASVHSYDIAGIKNYVCYNSWTAPGGDTNQPGYFSLTPAVVVVQRSGTPGNWDDRIRVTIQNYPMTSVIPMFPSSFKLNPVSAIVPVGSLGATY